MYSLTVVPSFVVIVVNVVVYDFSTGRLDDFGRNGDDGAWASVEVGDLMEFLVKIAGEEYARVFASGSGGFVVGVSPWDEVGEDIERELDLEVNGDEAFEDTDDLEAGDLDDGDGDGGSN